MSDRELLEKAAKAAGLAVIIPAAHQRGLWIEGLEDEWNPLTDDGDALRLAVKLKLFADGAFWMSELIPAGHDRGDPYAATRRAVVRAAASIGSHE